MQPDSIRKFTLAYLGSLALTLLASIIGYDALLGEVERSGLPLGAGAVAAGIAISAAITLLLWWLVARVRSVIAKWILVLLFLFNVVSGVPGLGLAGMAIYEWLALASIVAQAVAVYFLFQPDAHAWLAGGDSSEPED